MTISQLLWALCFFFLAFETFFRDYLRVFNYLDEGVAIVLLFLAVAKVSDGHKKSVLMVHEKRAVLYLLLFLAIGLMGNFWSGVHSSLLAIGIDVFTCSKFLIALLSGIIVFSDGSRGVVDAIIGFTRFLAVVLFACAALNLIADVGFSNGSIRWGIRSFSFIFYHPTVVNVLCVGLVALLATDLKRNRFFIFLCLIVMCLTLRSKGIAFAAVAFALLLLVGNQNRLSWQVVLFAALAAVLVGSDQFSNYYIDGDEARLRLTIASVEVANDFMPIGAGFATFASNITSTAGCYSSLYYEYGLSTVWGLSPSDPKFISDTFLPIILGQFGWAGLVVFAAFLYHTIRAVYLRTKYVSSADIVSIVLVFAYLIISSTAESAFFSNAATYFALCLALCSTLNRHETAFYGFDAVDRAGCRQPQLRVANEARSSSVPDSVSAVSMGTSAIGVTCHHGNKILILNDGNPCANLWTSRLPEDNCDEP